MQSLLSLRKPVVSTSLEDPGVEVPNDVAELYNRLLAITDEHKGIFPGSARQDIVEAAGRNLPGSWFRDGEKPGSDDKLLHDELAVLDEVQVQAAAELTLLREIKSMAIQCGNLAMSEAARNLDVHGPLLKHALKGVCPHVRRQLVTSARIAKPFVPLMADHAPSVFAEKKMVDFVLALDIPENGEETPGNAYEEGLLRRLGRDIRRVVQSQPNDCQTVNQTTYTPLWYQPAGVSIETKASGSAEEGRTQLAIWAAAWHRRIERFFAGGMVPGERVITLPLLLITEHDWNLPFAYDGGSKIEIMGDMTLGDTKSLKGVYMLVAAIRELGCWMEGPFAQWIAQVLAEAK